MLVAPPQVCGNILMLQYDSIEWKVQHFYESCKSLEYIEADREKPLLKIINNLGGETTDNTQYWNVEVELQHGLNVFEVSVDITKSRLIATNIYF